MKTSPPSPPRRTLQFNLQTLFVAITIVSVLVWQSTLLIHQGLFVLLLKIPLLAVVVSGLGLLYLKEAPRAFALGFGLGMLYASVVAWLARGSIGPFEANALLVFYALFPFFTGFAATCFHHLKKTSKRVPPPSRRAP